MNSKGRIRYVFTSSNTSRGFHTFIPELLEGLRHIFVLKGAPGSGKSSCIRYIGESVSDQGYEIEFWISAMDPMNPEGVYIPQMEAAVVNGSLPLVIEPKYPGITDTTINFSDCLDKQALKNYGQEIMGLFDSKEQQNQRAVFILGEAVQIKEQMIKTAAEHRNSSKIEALINRLEERIFKYVPAERHYYASTFTAEGSVNYIDEISSRCKTRYLFTGPEGSGQAEIISELAQRARKTGNSVDYYHCGLEPEHLHMVIIGALSLALIDAGEMNISIRAGDMVIKMEDYLYESDWLNEMMYSPTRREYEALLREAQTELENAHKSLKSLKRYYSAAMDFNQLEQIRQEICGQILSLGENVED